MILPYRKFRCAEKSWHIVNFAISDLLKKAIPILNSIPIFLGVVAPPRKLFPNWTKVSLRTTHDWPVKFKRANEKHSEQVLYLPGGYFRHTDIPNIPRLDWEQVYFLILSYLYFSIMTDKSMQRE